MGGAYREAVSSKPGCEEMEIFCGVTRRLSFNVIEAGRQQ